MSTRPRLAALLVLPLMALPLAACGQLPPAPDLSQTVEQSGVLRVAMDASFPPLESVSAQGRIVGIDPDLAAAIARRLGLRLTLINMASDGLKDAVIAGKADAVISSFTPVREWSHELGYSQAYYDGGPVLATGPHGASEGMIGVETGGDGEALARARWPGKVQGYDTPDEALQALARGQLVAAVVDQPDLTLFDAQGFSLQSSGPPLETIPYVVVVRKANVALLASIDRAISALRASGELQTIEREPPTAHLASVKRGPA